MTEALRESTKRTIISEKRTDSRISLVLWMAGTSEVLSPWWSSYRDRQLRDFWKKVDPLSGAVYALEAKIATIPFKIIPKDYSIRAHQEQAKRFNETILIGSEFGAGWSVFISKWIEDLLCLAGPSKIALGGERLGQTKTIASIVKDCDPGPVITRDEDGHFVERKIDQWHKSPLGDRRWWWISTRYVSGHSRTKRGGLFLTEDHPLLTDDGWRKAHNIEKGMMIATGDPEPSSEQSELLTGTILGDASIGINKRAMLRFTHAKDQEDWLKFKMSVLSGFQWTGYHESPSRKMNGYETQPMIGVNSRSTAGLNKWREAWYPKGRKHVSREFVTKHFSPRMMSVWYCDDGSIQHNKTRAGNPTSPNMHLHTHGFTQSDVEWLAGFLTGKGFPVSAVEHRQNGKVYSVLYVTAEGTRRLTEFIGSYVPPSMRYKLPDDAPSFDPGLWELEPARPFYDEVVESYQRDYKSGYRTVQTTYHIGIEETRNFIAAGLVSHNTQDNGAFAEILGDGDPTGPIKGKPYGINHLDSARCNRTSNPEFPVIYDDKNKMYRLHYTRVAFNSVQPSPIVEMNNVGFCAISKCLNIAQNLLDVLVYKQEKLGSRPARSILIGKGGLDADTIAEAFAMAGEVMDNRVLSRYSQSVVLGDAAHPGASLDIIDLASLPDGFDYQTDMMVGMALIALAFGVDARELFPMMGTGATRADALVQHIKARTKGIGHILDIVEKTFSPKFLPPTLEWIFDYTDDAQDRQVAEIKKIRSEKHNIDLTNEIVDERTAREQMVSDGDLTTEQFERLELQSGRLEDGSSVLSLFFDPDYVDILSMSIPNPLDVEGNDPDLIKPIISQKRDELIQGLGLIKNFRQRARIDIALMALEYLESLYVSKTMDAIRETPTDDDDEEPAGDEEPTEDELDLDDLEG